MNAKTNRLIPRFGQMPNGPHAGGRYCATGCGSWTLGWFMWRGVDTAVCERCSVRIERLKLAEEVGVPVRDTTFEPGLGSRIGLAVEETRGVALYVKGTDKVFGHGPPRFIVYVDGRKRGERSSWEAAYRFGANLMRNARRDG